MKKLFFRLIVLLCLAALFVMGLDWLLANGGWVGFGMEEYAGMRGIEDPLLNQGIGVSLMLLPVLALLGWFLVGRDESITARAKDGDVINLEPRAIERVVCREIRSKVEEVIKVDATASQGPGKRARVRVNVAVTDHVPVPQVRSAVRREAVKVLEHLFGFADVSQVRVVVYDVTGRAMPEGKRRRRPTAPQKPVKKTKPAETTSFMDDEEALPVRAPQSLPVKKSE